MKCDSEFGVGILVGITLLLMILICASILMSAAGLVPQVDRESRTKVLTQSIES